MLPTEKDPLTAAAAKARFVVPLTLAAVHCVLYQRRFMNYRTFEPVAYSIYHWQRSNHSVHKIYTSKAARSIAHREE
jgi:hypothetical protein